MTSTAARLCALALVGTTGCAQILDRVLDSAANAAGNRVGTAIGDRVGNAIVRTWTPQFTSFYTTYIFGLAFSAGGYTVTSVPYKPGDYTRWNIPQSKGESGQEGWIERAYLSDDDKGNQWWKVKFHDAASGDTTTLEALFNPADGRMLRLRGKFPDDEIAKEMPVDEQAYYVPPRALSQESVKGATVGSVPVSVPAGSFTASHVVFGDGGGNTHEWWLVEKVPGGTVKHVVKAAKAKGESTDEGELDSGNYTLLLQSYGGGARSELGTATAAQ